LARGIDLDDDIAVRAHANAESVPAIGYRPVRRAAHAAREVAGLDRPFADIVCDERRGEVRIVARGDRLIDIRMVRDVPAEPLVAADAALAHHPRDERRGPRVPPARADTGRPLPYRVLSLENPRAVGGRGPVARDRRRDASGLRRIEPRDGPPRPVRAPIVDRHRGLVDDMKAEEPPLLNGDLNDPPAQLSVVPGRARTRCDAHSPRLADDAIRRRRARELLGGEPFEMKRLGSGDRYGRERREHRELQSFPRDETGRHPRESNKDLRPVRSCRYRAGSTRLGTARRRRADRRCRSDSRPFDYGAPRTHDGERPCRARSSCTACCAPPRSESIARSSIRTRWRSGWRRTASPARCITWRPRSAERTRCPSRTSRPARATRSAAGSSSSSLTRGFAIRTSSTIRTWQARSRSR